jgi:mannose-6-phosphate isomerase
MRPQILPPNVLTHFYAGGPRIAALRGLDAITDRMPEEWIGAVNTTFGAQDGRGLSRLADGTLVRDAIAADPEAWLGAEHVARYGDDPALLTKLLDAGQRLPVHFHPGRALAARELGLTHGKTEAWIIVEAEPGAAVWVGFAEAVDEDTVRGWMNAQDGAAMLAAMRELPVAAGDVILVPAGTPHAIGDGILLVELQEPTDLSVCLEWEQFGLTEEQARLGMKWDVALEALDRTGWDEARLAGIRGPRDARNLMPAAADPYFRAERVQAGDALDAGFSVLIGLEGDGALGELAFGRGSTAIIPHSAGPLTLEGNAAGIRCRPPDPAAPEGEW